MTHAITIKRLFNGGASGYQTHHEVSTPRGLSRVLSRPFGHGWGCSVRMHLPSVLALGGWEGMYGQGVIPTPGGYVMVDLIPHEVAP